MNPIFWLLVILVLICLWFCATFMFRVLGGFLGKIFYDTVETMKEAENEEEKENA